MGDVIYAAVGAGRPVTIGGRSGVPRVLSARLCRAAAAPAGAPETGIVLVQLDSLVCALTMAAVAAALAAGPIHTAATRAPATVLVGILYPWGDWSCWLWPPACCQSAGGATSSAGSFWLPDLFCLRSRTRRISSRPPPTHTGLAPCSMPAGPRRHYWWRWPAGRLRRRWSHYRNADSAPTSSLWRALSWRLESPSWVTTHDSPRLWPR